MKTTDEIRARLFELQDLKYKEFNSKLIPTVPPERFIGVRIPDLRKLAKETAKETNKKKPVSSKSDSRIAFDSNEVTAKSESTKFTLGDSMGTENAMQFLNDLPHYYHEENALHGYIIEQIKDYETCLAEINRFLPYVDNWAVCDTISPKIFGKNKDKLINEINVWLASDRPYTMRFAIGMLLKFYLDSDFRPEQAKAVAQIRSEEYYVNMMIAWYFATALAKQYDVILPYLEEKRLPVWVHNKTVQKAVESYRITAEQKDYLKSLKIKRQ